MNGILFDFVLLKRLLTLAVSVTLTIGFLHFLNFLIPLVVPKGLFEYILMFLRSLRIHYNCTFAGLGISSHIR